MIGAAAGLGALALHALLALITRGALGMLAGFTPATDAGDGHVAPASAIGVPEAVPVLVAGGAVLGALLARRLAPAPGGLGTDATIRAVHRDPRGMKGREALVTTAASALTLGTGGCGGTEGPITRIGAAFGSVSARLFRLDDVGARIAATAGMAAGVGALLKAPLGGALLGAELLYRRGLAPEMLFPGLIASAVAYTEFAAVHGLGPMFGDQPAGPLVLARLPYFLGLGVLAGLAARCYCWSLHRTKAFFDARRRIPRAARPAVGGLAVGLLGLLLPGVLGTGYGTIQSATDAGWLLGVPLWTLLALPFAKIAGTSLTVGSGGVAGVFGPAMVIGAATGAASWRLLEMAGGPAGRPASFVIVGMAACVAAAARAPLTTVIMAVEMSGAVGHLLPAAIAVAAATVIMGDRTLYPGQPASPPRRPRLLSARETEPSGA
ncbi:chloride channel protein [Actinomadura verrucosospora]|uniref:Voltage-gated chloride channel n=1 Tax=Actinomadura verrucosospora TaxID=46165 RepID=A0A7D4A7U4_ACTVE|nr:chloride channel protein [Actinomadura verrucosospora]QKG23267.1 voltage-gated chloride channel [Actinomadura verrucosospora]